MFCWNLRICTQSTGILILIENYFLLVFLSIYLFHALLLSLRMGWLWQKSLHFSLSKHSFLALPPLTPLSHMHSVPLSLHLPTSLLFYILYFFHMYFLHKLFNLHALSKAIRLQFVSLHPFHHSIIHSTPFIQTHILYMHLSYTFYSSHLCAPWR